jgi:hypothetical protein
MDRVCWSARMTWLSSGHGRRGREFGAGCLFSAFHFSCMGTLRMVFGVSWRFVFELGCYSALAFEGSKWTHDM